MKRVETFIMILCFAIFFISLSFVRAFGVSTVYSDNYPLKMRPGEVKETFFLMRNIVEGDSDVIISSDLVRGNEVARLIDSDKSYDVPFGAEVEVPVRVEIPKDATVGSRYLVGVIFRPAPKGGGEGNIQFVVNIGKSFPVEVVGDNKQGYSLTVEGDEGLGAFAPFVEQHKVIFYVSISFFIISIIVLIVLIVLFSIKNKRLREIEISREINT